MKNFMRRIGLGLSTGYIFCYFGELMFWSTPDREGMSVPAVAMTWLVYSVFAYVFLCVVSVFRVRTLCSVFLAGAFFGWYEEGIFVQTMYGSPDGPFPMSISFTGLAWHALIDVCVGWYLVRMTLTQRRTLRTAGLAIAIGLFYGLWAIWWWNEPPEPMRLLLEAGRTDIVFVHFSLFVLSTTGVLILAYWLHNRLARFGFKPTKCELWGLGALTMVYFAGVTVPAAPKSPLGPTTTHGSYLVGSVWKQASGMPRQRHRRLWHTSATTSFPRAFPHSGRRDGGLLHRTGC